MMINLTLWDARVTDTPDVGKCVLLPILAGKEGI